MKDAPTFKSDLFHVVCFELPCLIKNSVSSDAQKDDWKKDYLSKNKNIEKYVYEACSALQIVGVSYEKYKKDLSGYTDSELNKGMGEIVGKNFEIEASLVLRRLQELFIESWYFKEIKDNKEDGFRYFF
jgi:hypothetical protein